MANQDQPIHLGGTRGAWIREQAKRVIVTLEKLQRLAAQVGEYFDRVTIS